MPAGQPAPVLAAGSTLGEGGAAVAVTVAVVVGSGATAELTAGGSARLWADAVDGGGGGRSGVTGGSVVEEGAGPHAVPSSSPSPNTATLRDFSLSPRRLIAARVPQRAAFVRTNSADACTECRRRIASRSMRFFNALPLALCIVAIGCENNSAPTPVAADTAKATAAPPKPTAAPTPTATAVTSTKAAPGSPQLNKENITVDDAKIDKSIPDIPTERSKPPTVDEWKTATVVNSQEKNSRADKCEMKVLREWLKIKCEGEVFGINDLDGFGAEGTDHFKMYEEGKWADIVVRLKEGQALSTRIPRGAEGDAALFTHWPKGAKKPNIIALGRGAYPTYSSCGG